MSIRELLFAPLVRCRARTFGARVSLLLLCAAVVLTSRHFERQHDAAVAGNQPLAIGLGAAAVAALAWLAKREKVLSRIATEWRETFDAIESPILLVDSGGRIARLNRAARDLAGLPFEALIGKPLRFVDSGEPWREASRLAEAVACSREDASAQVEDANGRSWNILASVGGADAPAKDRIIVVARDVSRVVRLEASLRRAEAVAAMGALVAGVAHEVRNPLFAISALLDGMEASRGGLGELEKYVGPLRGELDRVSRLMRDLLDYGKPPAAEFAEREFGDLVARVVRSCERMAAAAGVTLVNEVPSSCAVARVDPGRIAQALGNIVENAVQHSRRGGTVNVRVQTRRTRDEAWLEFTVTDGGPGFSERDLLNVFQPFYSRRRGGTGLGLSIVKSIAEAHGGRASAANAPEGGAVVALNLPLDGVRARRGGETCRGS